jgi:hypothetical protein
MGHGFYQFSPELFFNFLSYNSFPEIEIFICVDYNPILFKVTDPRLCGGRTELVNDEPAQIAVLAKKAVHLREVVYPIQSDYHEALWKREIPVRTTSQMVEHPVDLTLAVVMSANKKMKSSLLRTSKSTAPQLLNGFENNLQYKYGNPLEMIHGSTRTVWRGPPQCSI